MSKQYDLGVIGLAVMGQNLVLNMANHGFCVAVYNRSAVKTQEFKQTTGASERIGAAFSPAELVGMLVRPRKIMLMVKAGEPVDTMIGELLPYLEKGDIIIDGGNSFFEDTRRRCRELSDRGIHFLGMGVSGGEEGALHGPSLMPGGDRQAWEPVESLFRSIAAQVKDGACCAYIGSDGAGHYVKMVHNGIEYGDMQLIGEAYSILHQLLGLTGPELHTVFADWNKGELNSYLIEITSDIFLKQDEQTGNLLLDMVLDKAGQKGTGKWTSQSALELGVPVPTITEAVFARCMSGYKEERLVAARSIAGPQKQYEGERQELITAVREGLYASKICSYAQGFSLLKAAGEAYGWNLQYGDIALLWRGGCIIRAQFLDRIKEAFTRQEELPNLMLDGYFKEVLEKNQENWRKVLCLCKQHGLPTPAFSASLDYFDGYRQAVSSANLIQAQRDYFGAHTYERTDRQGSFHSQWLPE